MGQINVNYYPQGIPISTFSKTTYFDDPFFKMQSEIGPICVACIVTVCKITNFEAVN